jgi:hypothetical protein
MDFLWERIGFRPNATTLLSLACLSVFVVGLLIVAIISIRPRKGPH